MKSYAYEKLKSGREPDDFDEPMLELEIPVVRSKARNTNTLVGIVLVMGVLLLCTLVLAAALTIMVYNDGKQEIIVLEFDIDEHQQEGGSGGGAAIPVPHPPMDPPPRPEFAYWRAHIFESITDFVGGNGNNYWQYCSFKANRSVTIVEMGICAPPEGGHYRIKMKVVDELTQETLGETESPAVAAPGNKVYHVQFTEAVEIKSDTWYRAYVYISEGPANTFYGLQRRPSEVVDCGEGCAVQFQYKFHDGQPASVGFQV